MKHVSAILLAAGKGSRIGTFKPLLLWHGESFISKILLSMRNAKTFREIIVVTGYQAVRLEGGLKIIHATTIFNPEYEKGIHSSIRAGLRALSPGWSGALVGHVDQPQLESRDFRKIVSAFQSSRKSLARPYFRGVPGNPAILGVGYLPEIEAEPDADHGCAYLFERHPEDVLCVEMDDGKCTQDFDTWPTADPLF